MTDLRFLENMGDLQGHLDHMRHSNQLVTCDAEASKVTQGALATQIALKQSEANVVLRDTRRAEKTALALTRQLDAKQKRLDAQQVEMHGAELRNNQLQTTCVDAIANIESLNDQVRFCHLSSSLGSIYIFFLSPLVMILQVVSFLQLLLVLTCLPSSMCSSCAGGRSERAVCPSRP